MMHQPVRARSQRFRQRSKRHVTEPLRGEVLDDLVEELSFQFEIGRARHGPPAFR
jgi:hypothetical protein